MRESGEMGRERGRGREREGGREGEWEGERKEGENTELRHKARAQVCTKLNLVLLNSVRVQLTTKSKSVTAKQVKSANSPLPTGQNSNSLGWQSRALSNLRVCNLIPLQ